MNDAKDYALTIVDAIERLWMQNKAMEMILDQYQIPNWFGLVEHYCAQAENQHQAQQRLLQPALYCNRL